MMKQTRTCQRLCRLVQRRFLSGKSVSLSGKRALISNTLGGGRMPDTGLDALPQNGVELIEMDVDNSTTSEWRYGELVQRIVAEKPEILIVGLDDRIDSALIDAWLEVSRNGDETRVISNMAVGTNHIALDHTASNYPFVRVGYTPRVLTETTADLVLALTLATGRRLVQASNDGVFAGQWGMWHPTFFCGYDLHASKVAILGMGSIGAAVAKRLNGFGCDIHYCNSRGTPVPEATALGCTHHTSLTDAISGADFVIPMVPLTTATTHLIAEKELRQMGPKSILINVSRGEVVDQSALERALSEGWIAAAGLDVCTPEPIPTTHSLLKCPNLTILPHIGSSSWKTRTNMARLVANNVIDAFNGVQHSETLIL